MPRSHAGRKFLYFLYDTAMSDRLARVVLKRNKEKKPGDVGHQAIC